MTKEEAIKLLRKAPMDDMPSKALPGQTRRTATAQVRALINSLPDEAPLDKRLQRKVHQVVQDKETPRV